MSRGNYDLPRGDRDNEDTRAERPARDLTPAPAITPPAGDDDFFAYLDRLAKELHLKGEDES